MQQQLEFFSPNGTSPPESLIKWSLDPSNPSSPYYGYVGNEAAIRKLMRIDFAALKRYNHCCSDLSVAFIGKAGCGKTALARRHAKANGLPLVEISPKSARTAHDVFIQIQSECEKEGLDLVEIGHADHYVIPPLNVFIDEVHALSNNVVQALLKATEANDATLVTEKGFVIDCQYIHWMIATTDRGKLFDAFDTRFSKINVEMYTKDEIAKIVSFVYKDWPFEACELVAHYCSRIPREALAFAREMNLEMEMRDDRSLDTWRDAASVVAQDNYIDEFGMTHKRVAVLKALGQGPVASKRLPILVGVKPEELEKFIVPYLLESTNDQDALITVTGKGYTITDAGIQELNKRKIPHVERAA